MVLLVERLGLPFKLFSKMENHHHHHHHHHSRHHNQTEALSTSLQAFQSHISNRLNQLLLNSEIPSLSFIQKCFELLPIINKAFTKLGVEIDYPISKWEITSMEEYLKYTLNLLELLNSMTFSLSHLGQARLLLSHALSLVESLPSLAIEGLKPIQPWSFSKDGEEGSEKDGTKEKLSSGKELTIHQAMMVMKNVGFSVCGIVLSGLRGNSKQYGRSVDSSPSICEELMEKRIELKELKGVNDAVDSLIVSLVNGKSSDLEAKELQRKLEEFEKFLDGIGKEVDHLFSEVLAGRNELLDSIRRQKQ